MVKTTGGRADVALKLEATRVGPAEVVVAFYEYEWQLVDQVAGWLARAASEATLIVIATREHQVVFEQASVAAGLDWQRRVQDGALICLDAHETLDELTAGGRFDAARFHSVIGSLLRKTIATGRPVRAYGEMVAVLWRAGDVLTAVELEQAWNELLRELPLELMCAYPSELVQRLEHAESREATRDLHAAVLAPVLGLATTSSELTVSMHFRREPTGPGDARRFVRSALSSWGRPHRMIEDAELVVSEFATNAFLHARSPFTVELHAHVNGVRIEVSDTARTAHPYIRRDPHPLDCSGRGLRLVAEVATDWGFELTADGKTVWAELTA